MTLREVQTALRCISKRRAEASRFEAALHGMKLQGGDVENVEPVSGAKAERIDQHMKALMELKRKEVLSGRR